MNPYKILLIGDVMLDVNYICECNRLANEAPIPVYKIIDKNYILGGAGNVANHLKSLDLDFIFLSIVGDDQEGYNVKDLLEKKNIDYMLFIDEKRKTTCKNRIFVNQKLVSRFDNEDISIYNFTKIKEFLSQKNFTHIVISDYQKGLMSLELYEYLKSYAKIKNSKIICDPKDNLLEKYKDVYLLKPNKQEFESLIGKQLYTIEEIKKEGLVLMKNLGLSKLVVTLSELGICYFNKSNSEAYYIPSKNSEQVIDVTGAGDTILSFIVYNEIYPIDESKFGEICNFIGHKSVQTVGNYNISLKHINEFYHQNKNIDLENLIKLVEKWKNENKKIVFTNGCFDIIHRGHVQYLQSSKKLGDILIVGINTDNSIKINKGNNRPFNKLEDRIFILEQMNFIDYIVSFDEKTPIKLLEIIEPDIYTKGKDYNKDQICDVLGESLREKIVLINYLENHSSTKCITYLNEIKS